MKFRNVLPKLLVVARWIGVVILPIPVFIVVTVGLVPILNMGILGRAEKVSNVIGPCGLKLVIIMANYAGGGALAFTAAALAPSGKFVAAVAMSSVFGLWVVQTLIGNIYVGNGWHIAINIGAIAGLICGCVTVYAKHATHIDL